jgi:hypothetical protein
LSKLFAACEIIGISLKGFFVFAEMIVFQRTEPGMKMVDSSKPTRPFSSGAGMLATSLADLHPARS